MLAYVGVDQLVKNSDYVCDRLDSILALDGQTERNVIDAW